ncbi:DUF72 domain-containing protein [Alicyclobacillus vulcanalis]|uniref:Uncharacterized conserved protein YecE, DUF72 family n=2 Tax=Alicyclobacillus TaxID=29330 RepID=A0A1N7KT18_9BACL|nr:DUF72 domain-containing protein [Alicyclobacillus vulcanalis]SIS64705.1 Uncharacterized conserved protein YecE, DUF72 family [Alicyclobacillus vulcanalis]
MIRVGTCAFHDHDHFYPRTWPRSFRLAYYASYFDLVEIDSTFYGIVGAHVWERWVAQVSATFTFHVKAPGALTMHVRGLSREERRAMGRAFLEGLRPAVERGQLGVILLQFPPWFGATPKHRMTVERVVDFLQPHRVAVEFRERSWYATEERTDQTLAWLQSMGAVHVICDEPDAGQASVPYIPRATSADLAILRMHGRNKDTWNLKGLSSSKERFAYRYTVDELRELEPDVRALDQVVREVHILMNNNSNNDAVVNALDWMDILQLARRSRPPLEHGEQLPLWRDETDGGLS